MMRSRSKASAYVYGALVSGVAFPLALPSDVHGFGNPLVGLVALAPLLWSVCTAPSFTAASLAGALFGAISTFLTYYWLVYFHEFSVWTVGGVVLGYTLYHALFAPILRGIALRLDRARPLALAAAWTVYEYVKSSGFLAFPWGLIAHPFAAWPFAIQVADLCGVWGVSLLAAAVNAIAAEALLLVRRDPQSLPRAPLARMAGMTAAAVLLASAYGIWRLGQAQAAEGELLRVVLVQHNSDPWERGGEEAAVRTAVELSRRALEEGEADLVVWSETIIPFFATEARLPALLQRFPSDYSLHRLLQETRVPLLLGSPYRPPGGRGYQNAALLLSADGRLSGYYGKQKLVPFAERVPFWQWEPVRRFFERALGLTEGWEPGSGSSVLWVSARSGARVGLGTPICFEDAFPDLCRELVRAGADVLVNLTNVSWSQRESAMQQMLAAARFRSVETRRPLARATNGGVTAVIDPQGEIVSSLPMLQSGYLRAEIRVPPRATVTLYQVAGDWLPRSLGLCLLVGLIVRLAAERTEETRRG